MPVHCEVIEMRNSADAVGYPCSRAACKGCSDCGIGLCEDQAESCGTSLSIFSPPCRFIEGSTRIQRTGNVESENFRDRFSAHPAFYSIKRSTQTFAWGTSGAKRA